MRVGGVDSFFSSLIGLPSFWERCGITSLLHRDRSKATHRSAGSGSAKGGEPDRVPMVRVPVRAIFSSVVSGGRRGDSDGQQGQGQARAGSLAWSPPRAAKPVSGAGSSRGTAARARSAACRRTRPSCASSMILPASMKITRCATLRAKPISCVTTIMVMPSWASCDHDVEHLVDHLRVERRGRLVEQHRDRVHRQRARDRHALLLAAGELPGELVLVREQADAVEELEALVARRVRGAAEHLDLRRASGSRSPTGAGTARSSGTPCRCASAAWAGWSSGRPPRRRRR